MANQFNFNSLKKHYLTVTLPDDKKTVLMVSTPTKAVMEKLIDLQSTMSDTDDETANVAAIDDLYTACAEVMSRNKAGVKITGEYLAEYLDFQDVMSFLNAYMDFMSDLANEKN